MSRLSNFNTLRLGLFNTWSTFWFDQYNYSNILHLDLKVKDYFTGIFYKAFIVSDYIRIYRYNDFNVYQTKLSFFSSGLIKMNNFLSIVSNSAYLSIYYKDLKFDMLMDHFNWLHFSDIHIKLMPFTYYNHLFSFYGNNYLFSYFMLIKTLLICPFSIYCNLNYKYIEPEPIYLRNLISNKNVYLYYLYFSLTLFYNHYIFIHSLSVFFYFLLLLYKYCFFLFNWISISFCSIQLVNIFYCLFYNIVNNSKLEFVNFIKNKSNFTFDLCDIHFSRRSFHKWIFDNLRSKIEKTLFLFEQKPCFVLFSLFSSTIPFLVSAKVVTDYMVYQITLGRRIVPAFFYMKRFQYDSFYSRRRIEYLSFTKKDFQTIDPGYLYHYAHKRFPIIGMRMECSGNIKKGTMSQLYHYHSWVTEDFLTGRMPYNSFSADIDYYQSYAVLPSSSVGIKTWLFLETYLYNDNYSYTKVRY